MAIPFYEPKNQEENLHHQQQQTNQLLQQQQHYYEEVDQVDGLAVSSPPNPSFNELPTNSPPPVTTEHDVMAWQLLALAMCKALKDHYQQNMSSSSAETSSTAVIQILPNGQVAPSWN